MALAFDEFVKRTGSGYVLPKGVPSATFSFTEVTNSLMDYRLSWSQPLVALTFYAEFFPNLKDEKFQPVGFRRHAPSDAILAQLEKSERFRDGPGRTYRELNQNIARCESQIEITDKALLALKELFISICPPNYSRDDIEVHRYWNEQRKPKAYNDDDICNQFICRAESLKGQKPALKMV